MCGRYNLAQVDQVAARFGVADAQAELQPRYNVAPSQAMPVVVRNSPNRLVAMQWGLIPAWSKEPRAQFSTINARAETVATKPAFAKGFAARRCLLPADGYYEWQTITGESGKPVKQPWFVRPTGGGVLPMAGLYEFWRDRGLGVAAPWLVTCTVITTTAIDALGHVHDRMPMVVRDEDWAAWLDPHSTDALAAAALLSTPASDRIETYKVATSVNSVRNNGPDLITPVA